MERYVLTFGRIPKNNKADLIYCGDAESSETIELNFELLESDFKGLDNNFNHPCNNSLLWDPESELFKALSKFMSTFNIIVDSQLISNAYCVVNDEPDELSNSFEIIDSNAGIFSNKNQQHNGKLFVRQYFEEDGEIYNEKIFLSLNNNIK